MRRRWKRRRSRVWLAARGEADLVARLRCREHDGRT